MDYRDRILSMAKIAPVLPVQVAKALNTNSLFASAMLSELASKDLLKVSNLKMGSSPLYYIPELGAQLQNYTDRLNEKDKKAYDLLKEKKVLREDTLDPLTRVSIKSIKDFSRPLEVTLNDKKEIFWKWYLLLDSEAEVIIKQILNIEAPKLPEPKVVQEQAQEPVQQAVEQQIQPADALKSDRPKRAARQKKLVEAPAEEKELVREIQKKAPVQQKRERIEKEKIEKITETKVKEEKQAFVAEMPSAIKAAAESYVPGFDSSDPFLRQLMRFFQKNNIKVLEQKTVKKKTDYEFIVELNSVVGSLTYFCKAKNKKRVSEADLSSAFVQGQLKKLPVLVIAPGELTKQAQEIAKELKGIAVKMLDGS